MKLTIPSKLSGFLSRNWLAEIVRVSVFFLEPHAPIPLFKLLTSDEPLETVSRTSENLKNEVGTFAAGYLFVTQQGVRTDIIYTSASPADEQVRISSVPTEPQGPKLLHVGPASAAITAFLGLINDGMEVFDNSSRLAFGAAFVQSAESAADAVKLIKENEDLPISSGDLDILWQVNRPAKAKSFDGRINRLIKWQSAAILAQRFLLSNGQTSQILSSPQPLNFARLELDFNTLQSEAHPGGLPNPQEALLEVGGYAIEFMSSGSSRNV